jgi:hypothetical protein
VVNNLIASTRQRRTAIKDKFELDDFHVDQIRVDLFMGNAHSDMFHLRNVTLKGVIQSIFKGDEVRDLGVLLRRERPDNEF